MDDGVDVGLGEARSTRERFLKKLGTTLAIGLGFGLLSARSALATNSWCCANDQRCPPSSTCTDPNNPTMWRCIDCGDEICCYCGPAGTGCHQYGCGVCPT